MPRCAGMRKHQSFIVVNIFTWMSVKRVTDCTDDGDETEVRDS